MTKEEFNRLFPGVYRVNWKASSGGGYSIAALGVSPSGQRWLAPLNWVAPFNPGDKRSDGSEICPWKDIESVKLKISIKDGRE